MTRAVGGARGFTLLEVILATSLMAIVALAVGQVIGVMSRAQHMVRDRSDSEDHCRCRGFDYTGCYRGPEHGGIFSPLSGRTDRL